MDIDGPDGTLVSPGFGLDTIQSATTAMPDIATDVIKDFVDSIQWPLQQPLVTSPPSLRVTKVIDSDKEDDIVPKHNARLAAKNKFREPKPEAQARKVMMKRLGFETATEVPNQVSFEEFQQAFALSLSPMKSEAMDALFPIRRRRKGVRL